MANLAKCPQGHFYDADRFDHCPYCGQPKRTGPVFPGRPEDTGKTTPLNDTGKTTPLYGSGKTTPLYGSDRTTPLDDFGPRGHTPVPTGPAQLLYRLGGWQRALLMAAIAAMAICTLVVAWEGWQDFTFDSSNGFWDDEFVEFRHETATPLLLSAAGDGALLVCCVWLLRSRGEQPAPTAAIVSTAVAVGAAFYDMTLFRSRTGSTVFGLTYLLPYGLPPLLSCAAFWLYYSQQHRTQ